MGVHRYNCSLEEAPVKAAFPPREIWGGKARDKSGERYFRLAADGHPLGRVRACCGQIVIRRVFAQAVTGVMPYIAFHNGNLTGMDKEGAYILRQGGFIPTRGRYTEDYRFC